MKRTLSLLLMAVVSVASARNLVVNPDFSNGLDGWSLFSESGALYLIQGDGVPSPPSVRVSGDTGISGAAIASVCVPIDDTTMFDLALNTQTYSGFARASVIGYSDTGCESAVDSVDTDAVAPDGMAGVWTPVSMSDFSLTGQSARVVLSALPPDGFGRGDASFDHVAFAAHGTLSEGIDISQEGLGGAWLDPSNPGQGFQFAIGDGALFGAWYTFSDIPGGPQTQRWYSLEASVPHDASEAAVTIYESASGNFDAPPPTSAHAAGTGTLSFDSCTSGRFSFTLDDGRTGEISIRRLLDNVECAEAGVPAEPPSDFGLSGAWYDPETSGQGLLVEVNPLDEQVFVGWYAYAANGAGGGADMQRWFSGQAVYGVGRATMDFQLFVSTGGMFGSAGGSVTTLPAGSATLTFHDCRSATLDYAFDEGELAGRSGSVPLTRLGAIPASCSLGR